MLSGLLSWGIHILTLKQSNNISLSLLQTGSWAFGEAAQRGAINLWCFKMDLGTPKMKGGGRRCGQHGAKMIPQGSGRFPFPPTPAENHCLSVPLCLLAVSLTSSVCVCGVWWLMIYSFTRERWGRGGGVITRICQVGVRLGSNHFRRMPFFFLRSVATALAVGLAPFWGSLLPSIALEGPGVPASALPSQRPLLPKTWGMLFSAGVPPPTLLYLVFPCFLIFQVFWEA